MALDRERLVLGLVPNVLRVAHGPARTPNERLGLELLAHEDTEGRHQVLLEVLVLVVAPDEDEVGAEGIDLLAHLPIGTHDAGAVLSGRGRGMVPVGTELPYHLLWPAPGVLRLPGDSVA